MELRVNQYKINKMRRASHLLPPPGGEVVRSLLDEIEFLQRFIICTRQLGELYDIVVSPCKCGRFTIDERYLLKPGVYHREEGVIEVANLVEARAVYESFIVLRESRYSPETGRYTGCAEWTPYSEDSGRHNFIVSKWPVPCGRCKSEEK